MTCRKDVDVTETGVLFESRDEPRGYLFTDWVVAGMEVA
jgi:hypothetical protein